MPILCRRISTISLSDAVRRFWPLNRISPAVGSISRDMRRTSVDLPDPDRPMMTKISPRFTDRFTSRTAGTSPRATIASAVAPSPRSLRTSPARLPNSFQTWRH